MISRIEAMWSSPMATWAVVEPVMRDAKHAVGHAWMGRVLREAGWTGAFEINRYVHQFEAVVDGVAYDFSK